MVVKNLVPYHIRNMAYEHNMNPFGHRYEGDRRYRVWSILQFVTGSMGVSYGHVDGIQFKLVVDLDYGFVEKCRLLEPDEYFNVY